MVKDPDMTCIFSTSRSMATASGTVSRSSHPAASAGGGGTASSVSAKAGQAHRKAKGRASRRMLPACHDGLRPGGVLQRFREERQADVVAVGDLHVAVVELEALDGEPVRLEPRRQGAGAPVQRELVARA